MHSNSADKMLQQHGFQRNSSINKAASSEGQGSDAAGCQLPSACAAPGGTSQSLSALAPMCCVHMPPGHCLTAAAARTSAAGGGTRPVSWEMLPKLIAAAGWPLLAVPPQMKPCGHKLAENIWLVLATAVAW
jgi:hypothetical protein